MVRREIRREVVKDVLKKVNGVKATGVDGTVERKNT